MKLNEIYKVCIGEDIELDNEYEYYMCIAEKEEYFILHKFKEFCTLNGLDYFKIEDIDEEFRDKEEIDINHFKVFNSLEAVYYKNKEINHEKPVENKRKFIKV